jgi:hypothetical protein
MSYFWRVTHAHSFSYWYFWFSVDNHMVLNVPFVFSMFLDRVKVMVARKGVVALQNYAVFPQHFKNLLAPLS